MAFVAVNGESSLRAGGLRQSAEITRRLRISRNQSLENDQLNLRKWSALAIKQIKEGNFKLALEYLDKSLNDSLWVGLLQSTNQVANIANIDNDDLVEGFISNVTCEEEIDLLEKRLVVLIKLQDYERVLNEGMKTLTKKEKSPIAFKCLLAALAQLNRISEVKQIMQVWKENCPSDLNMISSRNTIDGMLEAVNNGIESIEAFQNVEDLLGFNNNILGLIDDTMPNYKHRDYPRGQTSFNLCVQNRFGYCSLSESCGYAHGEEELLEWKERFKRDNMQKMYAQTKENENNHIRMLQKQLQKGEIKLSEESSDTQIRCEQPLKAKVFYQKIKNFTWVFELESKDELKIICLLDDYHRTYFKIGNCFYHGLANKANLKIGKTDTDQILDASLTPAASALTGPKQDIFQYSIEVIFMPEAFGLFTQRVVFDFGESKIVYKKVIADVIPSPTDLPKNIISTLDSNMNNQQAISPSFANEFGAQLRTRGSWWNISNAEILDDETGDRVTSDRIGFALMQQGPNQEENLLVNRDQETFCKENYREKMRFILTCEERARQEILARYNLTTNLEMLHKFEMTLSNSNDVITKYAIKGTLFGRMTLFRDISEDTAVGRLILRNCNSVLLTKTEEANRAREGNRKPRVFLCEINGCGKASGMSGTTMYLKLGHAVVQALSINSGEISSFDIQFQLNRNSFIEQKRVIDRLQQRHLDMLFPDFTLDINIPWSPIKQWELDDDGVNKLKLNPKQKEALIAITAERSEIKNIPPILLIGPFGCGKTFTLAQCILKILLQPKTRIIICCHSNSAADLYIKEYLHSWYKNGNEDAKPLRIYYEKRLIGTVSKTVLEYCLYDNAEFRKPTKEEILEHRIIVLTLSTSNILMDLDLPIDTFSHILLDEAAQASESECITPILSAGPDTRLVLAGDHLQLSPETFSSESKDFPSSLLERLFTTYPGTHPCNLMLCENYRSHSSIIKFVSDSFYNKKLECGQEQPTHDIFYPLTFFAARGEDVQDPDSVSYYNIAEVYEITDKVVELIKNWPEKWGNYRSQNAIGVLTPYKDQIARIRHSLRLQYLSFVNVESVLNVQGKQFRVVILSTVRKSKQWVKILPETIRKNEVDLGFLSNPKLLNTALTRAQSLIAVVGDPVSLCITGKCSLIWEEFIKTCDKNKSLYGITYQNLLKSIEGAKLTYTWGLNPLAADFLPKIDPFLQPLPQIGNAEGSSSSQSQTKPISHLQKAVKNLTIENNNSSSLIQDQVPLSTAEQAKHSHQLPKGGHFPSGNSQAGYFPPGLVGSAPGPVPPQLQQQQQSMANNPYPYAPQFIEPRVFPMNNGMNPFFQKIPTNNMSYQQQQQRIGPPIIQQPPLIYLGHNQFLPIPYQRHPLIIPPPPGSEQHHHHQYHQQVQQIQQQQQMTNPQMQINHQQYPCDKGGAPLFRRIPGPGGQQYQPPPPPLPPPSNIQNFPPLGSNSHQQQHVPPTLINNKSQAPQNAQNTQNSVQVTFTPQDLELLKKMMDDYNSKSKAESGIEELKKKFNDPVSGTNNLVVQQKSQQIPQPQPQTQQMTSPAAFHVNHTPSYSSISTTGTGRIQPPAGSNNSFLKASNNPIKSNVVLTNGAINNTSPSHTTTSNSNNIRSNVCPMNNTNHLISHNNIEHVNINPGVCSNSSSKSIAANNYQQQQQHFGFYTNHTSKVNGGGDNNTNTPTISTPFLNSNQFTTINPQIVSPQLNHTSASKLSSFLAEKHFREQQFQLQNQNQNLDIGSIGSEYNNGITNVTSYANAVKKPNVVPMIGLGDQITPPPLPQYRIPASTQQQQVQQQQQQQQQNHAFGPSTSKNYPKMNQQQQQQQKGNKMNSQHHSKGPVPLMSKQIFPEPHFLVNGAAGKQKQNNKMPNNNTNNAGVGKKNDSNSKNSTPKKSKKK